MSVTARFITIVFLIQVVGSFTAGSPRVLPVWPGADPGDCAAWLKHLGMWAR